MLQVGSQGDIVKWLQYVLNSLCHAGLAIDRIFVTATKIAVQNYQASEGLASDGIVGQNTWKKILRL